MAKFSISKAWEDSKSVLKRDGRLIVPIALAFFVLPFTISDLAFGLEMQPTRPATTMALILFLLTLLISVAGQLAIQWISVRQGVTVADAIQRGSRRTPVVIAAGIILLVPLTLFLTPFLVPIIENPNNPPPSAVGLLFIALLVLLIPLARLSLTAPVGVVEDVGPIKMLKRSWTLTSGSTAKLYGLILLALIVVVIVSFVLMIVVGSAVLLVFGNAEPWSMGALVGGFVTQVVMALITVPLTVLPASIYAQLSGPAHADVSVPSSGT